MVGVPVLFMVWVGACWPLVWVMGVVVGVSGVWWCCFQYCVAVVSASRRVPGVGVCVSWLVVATCVAWFRMLMCVAPLSCFLFCLLFG